MFECQLMDKRELRDLAFKKGVLSQFVERRKRAAQFGSGLGKYIGGGGYDLVK